jgi:hypothetical protein
MTLSQILKSKTILFSGALTLFSIVQGYIAQFPLTPQEQAYAGLAVSVIIAILRFVTTEPISAK